MDLTYLLLSLAAFAAIAGLILLCRRLEGGRP
ncbi:hypothetical protein EV683_10841 [Crenobacter luteus]|nr:hypothetical protein EV683_10841 [Crenobacter luteus]